MSLDILARVIAVREALEDGDELEADVLLSELESDLVTFERETGESL